MRCVECKEELPGKTPTMHVVTGGQVLKMLPCYKCGRMHKEDCTGADNSAGQRYYLLPGTRHPDITLKPPKQ